MVFGAHTATWADLPAEDAAVVVYGGDADVPELVVCRL